jgi:uncharacterized membrane protein YqaE (UPF0057 family)
MKTRQREIIEILCAIFFPPMAVFLHRGVGVDLFINIVLCLLGVLPGITFIYIYHVQYVPISIYLSICLYNVSNVLCIADCFFYNIILTLTLTPILILVLTLRRFGVDLLINLFLCIFGLLPGINFEHICSNMHILIYIFVCA